MEQTLDKRYVRHYLATVIRSFRSKALQSYFETGNARRISIPNTARVGRLPRALDEAEEPSHMNLPGFRFHALKGDRRNRYAITASGNWRITFGWDGKNAIDVYLEDYH